MKKNRFTIRIVLILFGIVPMLILGFGVGARSVNTIQNQLIKATYQKLYMAAEDMSTFYHHELVEDGDIEYDTEYIDGHLKDDIELTLFLGDTRYITSIKDSSGNRNEGTKADSEIYATVSAGNNFEDNNVVIGGGKYYVCYVPLYDANGDVVGMCFAGSSQSYINRILNSAISGQLLIIAFDVIVCLGLILFFSRKLKKSMNETADALLILSEGNISAEVTATSKVGEIQKMIFATDTLQKKLSDSIGLVKSTAGNLDESVETVDGLSISSARGAEQIKEAVNGLAVTAQTMAATLLTCNENLIDMGENISSISEKVKGVSDDADQMLKINDDTMDFMNQVQDSTAKAVNAIQNIEHQTKDTNEAVERIKSAAQIIADIADQTNLLSLNASIEAARAGEAGKGFAVVADNIKQLAEQSADSANSIQDVVNEIVSLSEGSVALADDTVSIIRDQEQVINETVEKITDLNGAVHIIVENVDAIDTEIENLDTSKEAIIGNLSDLSAIAQENAASSEEVTANVESIAEGIEGTKDQSSEMKNMAEELIAKIKYFK